MFLLVEVQDSDPIRDSVMVDGILADKRSGTAVMLSSQTSAITVVSVSVILPPGVPVGADASKLRRELASAIQETQFSARTYHNGVASNLADALTSLVKRHYESTQKELAQARSAISSGEPTDDDVALFARITLHMENLRAIVKLDRSVTLS